MSSSGQQHDATCLLDGSAPASGLSVRRLALPGLVAELSFSLAAGECLALLGASGSGKTRLLRAIADLDPNDGYVLLDGHARAEMPAPQWRRLVGYVAAEPAWWADTVDRHFPSGEPPQALLERVRLERSHLQAPVATLSSGERQRLGLLRALLRTPRVLLLDEPTSALDEAAARAVETLLDERMRAGMALVLATHDRELAAGLARRCLRLENGIAHAGSP